MAEDEPKGDLPLMSNVNDILVQHYNFNFQCNFESKDFTCCCALFLKTVLNDQESDSPGSCPHSELHTTDHNYCKKLRHSSQDITSLDELSNTFILILDCHQIVVNSVESLNYSSNEWQVLKFSNLNPASLTGGYPLEFSVSDWCLKIWRNNTCKHCFPKAIRIIYKTLPSSLSVMWVKDQEGNPAVFSYGAAINNRALFPCQEPPVAMATWEATVTVSDPMIVLMSGDDEPVISQSGGFLHYYYCTRKPLPLATLSLAIGSWKEHLIPNKNRCGPKCRIFACPSLLQRSIQEFSEYIPYCLKNSEELLGDYPFSRIDFLIVPPTFGSLGMASPNLVFLSQSVLAGDQSLCSRISHEVAHGWFGLSLGALDWTEEWLSEGFATFLEDIVHVRTRSMSSDDAKEYMELKAFIRKKTLMDEIRNTNEELQILQPSLGEVNESVIDGINVPVLKEGRNPLKGFIQVHYIKGYFLLRYLCDKIGVDAFMDFLKMYVKKYEGYLVTSKEFLDLFFNSFPMVTNTTSIENIYDNWLHNSGTVSEIEGLKPSSENKLYIEILEETEKWKKFNYFIMKKKSKRRKWDLDNFCNLRCEQILLVLENLLDEEQLSIQMLKCLNQVFQFKTCNAEVQHRWFELVVKHKYKHEYTSLRNFLTDQLAMGVYLYGELICSGDKAQMNLAQECFSSLQSEMEPNYISTINEMFLNSQDN